MLVRHLQPASVGTRRRPSIAAGRRQPAEAIQRTRPRCKRPRTRTRRYAKTAGAMTPTTTTAPPAEQDDGWRIVIRRPGSRLAMLAAAHMHAVIPGAVADQ